MIVLDFETEGIEFGSGRSPKPVGVSIYKPGGKDPQYFAWGHPSGNNCSWEDGKRLVAGVWNQPLLFQNGKFDIGVAMEHYGLPWPKQWDDTMFEMFLDSPIVGDLGLKPSAHRLLGMPPDEQDAVGDWLRRNGVVAPNAKDWGAHICKAPADIVAPYANGDVIRTWKIHELLHPSIMSRGMEAAYQREILLAPIFHEAEVRGVRINRVALGQDIERYSAAFNKVSDRIRALLNAPGIDLDKGGELARALEASPRAGPLPRTPTGRLSTAKAALEAAVVCPELKAYLRYRGALKTLLNVFMIPWYQLSARDGRLHPNWNQVKGTDYGTRTGRMSCSSPNMQNVPTEFDDIDQSYFDLLLPFMRQYVLPDQEGQIIVSADYNGQEMRLLAHFAEGRAAEIYRNDPKADFHNVARDILHTEAGLDLKRKPVKIVGFSLIYGAGDENLAGQLGINKNEARHIRKMYLKSIPGLREFQDDCSSRDRVKTWGGRIIPVEPPSIDDEGRIRHWNYRLPNHLIQGSAADQTKESIIRYHSAKLSRSSFMLTVHDENDTSCWPEDVKEEVAILRESMEGLEGFDVPFIAEVETGIDWHNLEKFNG